MRADRVEQIIAELGTWMWFDQKCIWKGKCTTVYWNAKPENISEIWPDPNPSYKLIEQLASDPNMVLNEWAVGKTGSRQVCPTQDTRYTIFVQTRKGYVATWGHIIVWQ
jgi:hypothetical protein